MGDRKISWLQVTKEAAFAWLETPLNSPEQVLCRTPFTLSPTLCFLCVFSGIGNLALFDGGILDLCN